MVKSRMTALDVRASVEEMQSTLVGLRLLNIYDINEKKMFLFKFGHGENKKTVLLENGLRLHLTDLVREKPKVPSQFTLGLRKMVRAWRLDSVSQLQHDRTIDMCFGVAAVEGKSFHIIIELFGKGNVILTDHAYMIKVLLRSHKDADVNLRVGNSYPVAHADADAVVVDGVSASGHVDTEGVAAAAAALDDDTKSTRLASLKAEWETTWARNGDDETVKTTLSGVRHFGPALADNILVTMGVENKKKKELVAAGVDPSDLFDRLSQGMLEAWDLAHMALPPGGYLIRYAAAGGKKKTKPQPTEKVEGDEDHSAALAAGTEAAGSTVIAERYDDFTPVLLAQFTKPSVTQVRLESFGKVCDTFFLPTEVDKIDLHNDKKDKKAESKREKFERDHQRRLSALEREQEISQRKGELLMLNAEMVDEAIALINGALATGIQWDALKVVLRRRHAEGHPVAYMIHELMLERNSISVLLEQTDLYDDEDAVDVEPEVVEVDLSKTAHANASDYFTKKKANRSKWEKTVAATDKAAAGAARKADRVAAKKETKKQIVKERARAWWEKLFWFRTTAGDVVFQGKDVQTTELLVRRTMKLGDIFVSCDVPGALPCLVRPMHHAWEEDATTTAAAEAASPIAMASIEEAGAWCVSRSAAWESKQSMGAWWVYASQITGGTATGCYLYRGERHTLLPQPLSLGCGLLFKVARTVTADEALPARLAPAASDAPEDVMVPPDTASSLSPLPSVEALRQQQRRATQRGGPSAAAGRGARPKHGATTAPAPPPPPSAATAPASPDTHADPVSEEAAATQDEIEAVDKTAPKYHKDRKTKKLNKYFTSGDAPQPHRNARANKADDDDVAGKKGKGKGKRSQFDSESDGDDEDDTTASRPQQQQQQQPLTRHQKKKLKKIQAKYGDQDEEDRARGAMLNGNQLSKVQQRELEVQAMREREEKLAQEQEEKAARDKLKAEGKLHYHAVDDEERSADDSEASDVEEVSDFSEDADGHAGAAAAAVTDNEDNNEEADDKDEAAGEADEDAEDDNGDDGDATTEAAQTQQDDEEGRSVAPSSAASHVHDATNLSPQALAAAQANDDELKKAWVHYTSSPTADDIVEHVLCVCAPFSTLVTCGYAYRMEFVCAVNNIKKGQVAQAVIESFMRLQKQAADAAAPQEEKAKGDAASGAASKKKNNKSAATTTVTTPVITSASLLAEMANLSVNDVVEQLRGNLKPPSLRAK